MLSMDHGGDSGRQRPDLRQEDPRNDEVRPVAGALDLAAAKDGKDDHKREGRHHAEIEDPPAKDEQGRLEHGVGAPRSHGCPGQRAADPPCHRHTEAPPFRMA